LRIVCRHRLRDGAGTELIVDFMPDDESILGFSNRWYTDALVSPQKYKLPDGTVVRVVAGPYFMATKLEAYLGRGNNDPIASRDIEDVLNLIDGRESLHDELVTAPAEVRHFVSRQLSALLGHRDFEYAVQACARNASGREEIILQRIDRLVALA
jgi:predicted nucleotidyltransferase